MYLLLVRVCSTPCPCLSLVRHRGQARVARVRKSIVREFGDTYTLLFSRHLLFGFRSGFLSSTTLATDYRRRSDRRTGASVPIPLSLNPPTSTLQHRPLPMPELLLTSSVEVLGGKFSSVAEGDTKTRMQSAGYISRSPGHCPASLQPTASSSSQVISQTDSDRHVNSGKHFRGVGSFRQDLGASRTSPAQRHVDQYLRLRATSAGSSTSPRSSATMTLSVGPL